MSIKECVAIALFAALIAVLGFLPAFNVYVIPVPITVQTLGVMLAGAMLGAKRGFLACLVFLILVAAGLPLLSGGRGGLAVFYAPTSGYLYSFPFAAGLIGLFYQLFKHNMTRTKHFIALISGGIVLNHIFGIMGMVFIGKIAVITAILGDLIFVPGDLVKVVIAYFIVSNVKKALPNFMQ